MINLRSHVEYDEKAAKAIASAIETLLEQTHVLQVLWKFNKRKESATAVDLVAELAGLG